MKKLLLILFTLFIISFIPVSNTRASILFVDSFLGTTKTDWIIPDGFVNFITLPSGITGLNSSQWSVLEYPINQNISYEISLDLYINNSSSTHIWTFGIKDDKGNWKILNTWDWALQLREYTSSGERNIAFNWDRSLGKHHFIFRVSPNTNSKFEVIEDNKLLYSWETLSSFDLKALWIGILGYGDYEFSNFKLCDQDGCAAVPTSTPTPTSTPYPTDTPTPTPTSVEPKKVLVIPGMGGSWNKDAFLKCKLDNYAGEWTPWLIDGKSPYQSLITSLKQQGFEAVPFFYDWRKPVSASTPVLRNFIKANIPTNTFEVVGHSFGGLLARRFLEEETTNSRVNTLLTVGSPHQGAVLAYPSWSGGEMWVEDVQMRLGATLLQVGCLMSHQWTPQQAYEYLIPSLQNILPTFDYLKNNSGTYIPIASMIAKNNWLPSTFDYPFFGTTVKTITGSGYDTLRELSVRSPNLLEQKIGIWADGKPIGTKGYADGDGTVLVTSSQISGAQNTVLPLDHLGLVTNATGIQTILDFLGSKQTILKNQSLFETRPTTPPAPVSALLVVVDGAHAVLKTKNGRRYQDTDGQITLLNPEETTYTVIATPELKLKAKYTIVVIQLFKDGTTKWKSYERHDMFRKQFKLRFSTKQPTDDVLTDK